MSQDPDETITLFECLGGVLAIEEVPHQLSETGKGWVMKDRVEGDEIEIHPDDLPAVIAMLEAFYTRMDDRDDVTLETDIDDLNQMVSTSLP